MYIILLTIKNAFAHKDTVVSFKNGINWLVGENEGGKSELLDMIGYALFGQGLKTNASDYKGLEVSLYFKIADKYYFVQRSKTVKFQEVELHGDGFKLKKEIAVGISASNNAIIERLGYNYSVYEYINYSKQLDSTSLTSAGKTDRLNLINKVNGVHEATAFEKHLESNRKDIKSQLKVYQGNNLVELVDFTVDEELEQFTDPEKVSEIIANTKRLYEDTKALEDLRYQVQYIPKVIPTTDEELPLEVKDWELEDVKVYLDKYKTYNRKVAEHTIVSKNLEETFSQLSVLNDLKSNEELELYASIVQNNKAYDLQQKLMKDHLVTCPSCETSFTPEHVLKSTVLEFIPLNMTNEEYINSVNYIKYEQPKHDRFLASQKLASTTSQVLKEEWLQSYPQYGTISVEALEKAYKAIYSVTLQTANKEKALKELFEKNPTYKSLEDIEKVLLYLPVIQHDLTRASELKDKGVAYAARKQVYEASLKAQESINKQVKTLEDKLVIIESLLSESKRLKLEIQNNCIPVLNTIASKMINKLTGGKRYGLTLNDTFELILDGKPVQAYSGSTIVLANVAFRIALIEMFFKKNFPVFIGDEIDAFADPVRAQHIHDSLLKLNKEGYQLILVSHNLLDFQGNKINLADIKKVK